ncbi:adenosylcobinamide-GDP ribazoletransferase [uncultured Dialister sp.]|jgi:adenosylcobinamide-GDP ribazoletransferase|uniref:adenosylcobinamide-GDP ribazoletransferase n=1 Tax=uncultured Dialister sp. TaxID=278064 RepID=UPI0025E3F9A4|nr:adenosylcobinamide-GDP ribazoletransferase [uncultured Dialister sp.]
MNSFLVGLQFMTRIHISNNTIWKDEEFGKSVVWFPVYGWILGVFMCLIYYLLKPLDVPYFTAFLIVIGELFLSGGTLADGLMDSSDGLFSGRSRERSLEIMKDSLIGSFGMLSIIIFINLYTLSLGSTDALLYPVLIAAPTLGRLNLVISICEYPYARPYGMGKAFATYRGEHAVAGAVVLALLPALYFGFTYLILAGAAVLLGLYLNRWIVGKIGGTTGDTYGFVNQITEMVLALLFLLITRGNLWHML